MKKRPITALLAALLAVSAFPLGAAQAPEADILRRQGEGMCISILAEGFLTEHESFVITSNAPKLTKAAVDEAAKVLNAASESVGTDVPQSLFVSDKIPFAYDYGDGDSDVFAGKSSDSGTAMISIAAGNNSTMTSTVSAARGVAPEAQVLAMKVYSSKESKITATATASAIEDSLKLGADVILMSESVISDALSDNTATVRDALDKAEAAGVITVCPAGDVMRFGTASIYDEYELFGAPTAFPDTGMIAYTGMPDSVLTVGCAVSNELVCPAVTIDGGTAVPYGDSNYLYQKATDKKTFADFFNGRTLEYVIVSGVGTPEQLSAAGELSGKLAVIDRGELSFSEKAVNAAAAGAIGVIVADTQTNEVSSLEAKLELTDAPIPVIIVSAQGARYLKTASVKKVSIAAGTRHAVKTRETPSVSNYSARGTTPDLLFKPDITAFGDKIECVGYDGTFAFLSSTCASAAKVAGMCAALKSKLLSSGITASPTETANEIRNRLIVSAKLMKEDDGSLYSPRAQGGGAADLDAAMNVPLILTHGTAPKIVLGDKNTRMLQFRFTAKSMSDTVRTWTLDATVGSDGFRAYSVAELDSETKKGKPTFSERTGYDKNSEITVTDGFGEFENTRVILGTTLYQLNPGRDDYNPFSFTLGPGASTTFDITVYIDEATYRTYWEVFPNGFFVEGYMRLRSGEDELSIPMQGFCGSFDAAPALDGELIDGEITVFDGVYIYRGLDESGYTGEGSVILGASMPANITESTVYDRSKLAFSPIADAQNAQLYLNFALLRTVTDVNISVKDGNGNTVHSESFGTVRRTYSRSNAIYRAQSLPIWDGKADDSKLYIYPEGIYTVTVSYRKPTSTVTESFSYDIMLDVTAPTLVSTKFYFDKKTPLLDVTAEDNFAVRSITVTDSKGHTAEKTDDGRLDLSKLTGEHIYIDIFDYALNSTVVRLPNPTLELLKPTTAP